MLHHKLMVAFVGGIYVLTAASYLAHNRPGMAVAFLGYAIGNLGFFMDA